MPVSPGDRFQPKARDWNRLKENLPSWQAPSGATPRTISLPCVTAILRGQNGQRRPVWGEAVSLYITGFGVSGSDAIPASLPLNESWEPSEREKELFRFSRCDYQLLNPNPWGTSQTGDLNQPFAVCIDPRNMRFAISGMAIVRVRFHSKWHLFARRPISLPGENINILIDDNEAEMTGTLDSSGSGPAQIVGVLFSSFAEGYGPFNLYSRPWPFVTTENPNPVVWAVIRW
jgi:hypothetical protein